MIKIPIAKPSIKKIEKKYFLDCIKSEWISSRGKYIVKFEKYINKYLKSKYCVTCSNGTAALIIALKACGIKKNDEVIVPDISFASTINAVINIGAKPVICEVDKETWCLDVKKIENRISKKTKAIIPVHIYGNACNMRDIIRIKKKYKLFIIEDAAEAIGTTYDDKYVGTFGDVGCFSFFANKVITTGEGGCCITSNKKIYENLKKWKNNGLSDKKKYYPILPGYNFKITNIQSALGLAQLINIKKFIRKRNEIRKLYEEGFVNNEFFKNQYISKNIKKSEWLYTVLVQKTNIDKLSKFMQKEGIETRRIFYPYHQIKIYKKYLPKNFDKKNSSFIHKYGLSLPTYNDLKNNEINKIILTIKKFLKIK
jgi:perosamine synthetase